MNYLLTALLVALSLSIGSAQTPVKFASIQKGSRHLSTKKFVKKKKKIRRWNKSRKSKVIQNEFELVGGLIFIKAEINGELKDFVLDTGAPHLLLNSDHIKRDKKSKHQISGIDGNKDICKTETSEFDWNGISNKKISTYIIDLDHLENNKGRDIGGLIGYDLLKKHEVVIDYKNNILFLVPNSNKDFFIGQEKVDKIPFSLSDHIPIVKAKIGKKTFYFGIDSGAEVNVIDTRLKKRIPKEMMTQLSTCEISGTHQKVKQIESCNITSTNVGNTAYENMQFVFTDISYLQKPDGLQFDGLLGYPFLKQANFSINYQKRKLFKWEPENLDNEPVEMMVVEPLK